MKTTAFFAVVLCTFAMFGLMGVDSRRVVSKMATCEITNTSGVYPIYGTITLTQTNCPCVTWSPDESPPDPETNCTCMNESPNYNGHGPPGHHGRPGNITITVSLKGFNSSTTQEHGFHVHEHGDLGDKCKNAGGHLNPADFNHGPPSNRPPLQRHVGDLGNVRAVNGVVDTVIIDWLVSLFGPASVIGRSFVVHEGEDDLGLGNNTESLRTGNAGPRYGCCIIREVKSNDTRRTTTAPTDGVSSVAGDSSLLLLLLQLINAFILSDRRH